MGGVVYVIPGFMPDFDRVPLVSSYDGVAKLLHLEMEICV